MDTVKKISRRSLRLLVVTSIVTIVWAVLCVSTVSLLHRVLQRRQIEQLLGTHLPASTAELRYYKDQPFLGDIMTADAWSYHTTYIRFRASEAEYVELMQRIEMESFDNDKTIFLVLWSGNWKADPRLQLDWWNPKLDNSRYATAKDLRRQGGDLVLAVYEDGYVFIQVTGI